MKTLKRCQWRHSIGLLLILHTLSFLVCDSEQVISTSVQIKCYWSLRNALVSCQWCISQMSLLSTASEENGRGVGREWERHEDFWQSLHLWELFSIWCCFRTQVQWFIINWGRKDNKVNKFHLSHRNFQFQL